MISLPRRGFESAAVRVHFRALLDFYSARIRGVALDGSYRARVGKQTSEQIPEWTSVSVDIEFDPASLKCRDPLPTQQLSSSVAIDWREVLLEEHIDTYKPEPFDTGITSDLTIVMALSGIWKAESFENGRWWRSLYVPGTVGVTPSDHRLRLRLTRLGGRKNHRTAHLYVPRSLLCETEEEFRRIGQPYRGGLILQRGSEDKRLGSAITMLCQALRDDTQEFFVSPVFLYIARHLVTSGKEDQRKTRVGRRSRIGIHRAIEYLRDNVDQQISLSALAKEAAQSKFHFCRLFREVTGETPLSMLSRLRIERAVSLLLTSYTPISEIAGACGFSRPDHFSRAFKRHMGVSPIKFRTMQKK